MSKKFYIDPGNGTEKPTVIKREEKKEPERPDIMYAVMVPQKFSDMKLEQPGPLYIPLPVYVNPPDNEPAT